MNNYNNLNNDFDQFGNYIHGDNNTNNHINNEFIQLELHKGNRLKQSALKEQQAMRKAYCKANNIPYEEVEIEEHGFGQGGLKVFCLLIFLFVIGTLLSILWTI